MKQNINRKYSLAVRLKRNKQGRRKKLFKNLLGFVVLIVAVFIGSSIYTDRLNISPSIDMSKDNMFDITKSGIVQNVKQDKEEEVSEKWNLILVNQWNKLPEDFAVVLETLKNGHAIDKRAYKDLQEMMDTAKKKGLSLVICSSFRSKDKQHDLFNKQVSKYNAKGYSDEEAVVEASKWVARPDTSEHQTGLALDIVALSYQILDEKQADTREQQWLMANSYKYGFILRYPKDKTDITGVGYEPWHYRYVGKEAAKEIYERSICLEEYLEEDGK